MKNKIYIFLCMMMAILFAGTLQTGLAFSSTALAQENDVVAPTIVSVENEPSSSDVYEAPSEIQLPIITYTDDNIDGLTSEVKIFFINRNSSTGEETNRVAVSTYDVVTYTDFYRKIYKVNCGYLRASKAGEYLMTITTCDAVGNERTTSYTYNVTTSIYSPPVINNIDSREENIRPHQSIYLDPPSFTLGIYTGYGYAGVDYNNVALWYSIFPISAPNSNYEITDNYFHARGEGSYSFCYKAYLIKYNSSALVADDESLIVSNGELYYNNGYQSYRVYVDTDTESIVVDVFSYIPSFVQENTECCTFYDEAIITINVSNSAPPTDNNTPSTTLPNYDTYLYLTITAIISGVIVCIVLSTQITSKNK